MSFELLPVVTGFALHLYVTPDGSPLTDSWIAWAVPDVTAVLMLYDVELPRLTVREVGLAESEKSAAAAGLTVIVCVAGALEPPLLVAARLTVYEPEAV